MSVPPDLPRVLFFGPRHSGKSALFGGVLRRATAAPKSHVEDLRDKGTGSWVRHELMQQSVRVTNPQAGAFELYDCDGQAASGLLSHADELVRAKARGVLAEALRTADALVLAVAADAPAWEVEQTFRQFGQLLAILKETRRSGRQVGGWPIFLTLTKADRLALDDDGPFEWLARVEERKAGLRKHFAADFPDEVADAGLDLPAAPPVVEDDEDDEEAEPGEGPYLRFGSLAVSTHATAAEVPERFTPAVRADAAGGFGLDDLAAQCLAAAREQNDRVAASRRRLNVTLFGVSGLLTVLVAAVLGLMTITPVGPAERLAARVRAFRAAEPPPAGRLGERRLAKQAKDVKAMRDAPGFDQLPPDLREYVEGRVAEADDYLDYRAKFRPPILGPAEVRTRDEVDTLRAELAGNLAPPPGHLPDWDATEYVRLWRKWQKDTDLVTAAEEELHEWYRGLIRQANELLLTRSPPDGPWRAKVTALFAAAKTPPFAAAAAVPGSPDVDVPRGKPLTYAPAGQFVRVDIAKRDWDDTRARLRGLADVTDALGLTSGPGTHPPALDLPEWTPTSDVRGLAATRLDTLRLGYPPRRPDNKSLAVTTFPEWFEEAYPEAVKQAVERRAAAALGVAAEQLGKLVVRDAGGATPDGLRKLVGTPPPPALAAWDTLTALLGELATRTPGGPTPLAELTKFVAADSFPAKLTGLTLALPDDLLADRARPDGDLTLTVVSAAGSKSFAFAAAGDPRRDYPVTVYRFEPRGHDGTLTLTPGDSVTAALAVKSRSEAARLAWQSGREAYWRFDCFNAVPTLSRGDGGLPAPAVRLSPAAGATWPTLPLLLRAARR